MFWSYFLCISTWQPMAPTVSNYRGENKWVKFQFWLSSPFVSLDTGLCNLKGLTAIHVQGKELFYPTEKLPLCAGFITMIYLFST